MARVGIGSRAGHSSDSRIVLYVGCFISLKALVAGVFGKRAAVLVKRLEHALGVHGAGEELLHVFADFTALIEIDGGFRP